MTVTPPQFSLAKRGRKGYAVEEVDQFVDRVLERLNGDTSHDGLASGDIGAMWFNEARGGSAYDASEVGAWLTVMRGAVEDLERRRREDDLPADREGSVLDMPAPPHFADRFPRVSRAVLGFSVAEVDQMMERLSDDLTGPNPPTGAQIVGARFNEEPGGYRQASVTGVLELIAIARDLH